MPYNTETMNIFLISQTLSKYRILARVLKTSEYVPDIDDSLYPQFDDENDPDVISRDSSPHSLVSTLIIPKEKL